MGEGRFVVNASPLIFLAKVGQLDLLRGLAGKVIVPSAVLGEVLAGEPDQPELTQVKLRDWLRIEPDLSLPTAIAGWDLGAGESQVLAFAVRNQGFEAVLDDLQARRCARSLGVPTTGTLGVILRAKKRSLIPQARPIIEELLQHRMHLSRELIESALAEVGESDT